MQIWKEYIVQIKEISEKLCLNHAKFSTNTKTKLQVSRAQPYIQNSTPNVRLTEKIHFEKMAICLNNLKLEIKTLEKLFSKSHELFQIVNASVDELTCRFISKNGKKTDIHANITVSPFFIFSLLVLFFLSLDISSKKNWFNGSSSYCVRETRGKLNAENIVRRALTGAHEYLREIMTLAKNIWLNAKKIPNFLVIIMKRGWWGRRRTLSI